MTHPPPDPDDRRLDELFARYWDDALTDAQADELNARLAADPAARRRFRLASLLPGVAADRGRNRATRRRVGRRWAAGGAVIALGLLVALVLARRPAAGDRADGPPDEMTLVQSAGTVRVGPAGAGRTGEPGQEVRSGDTVATVGPASSAVLAGGGGTTLVLTGDTEARVDAAGGGRLTLDHGAVTAEVPDAGPPLVVATAEVRATTAARGCKLSVCRTADRTEIGVLSGRVHLTAADGEPLMDIRGGEVGTVAAGGVVSKQPATGPPDEYAWDLTRPLPPGWGLGRVVADPLALPFRRAVVPGQWDDPAIRRTCWQIRSDNRWVHGLFALHPDTRVRVRYQVDRAGEGQLLAVVRQDPPVRKAGYVLLAPLAFAPAADGGWRTAEFATADWVEERVADRPSLDRPPPWTAFLVVFNTYEQDLGLKVAEFTVGRGPLPGPAD